MNHIIALKDGSHYRITEAEANKLFEEWSKNSSIIQIPRGIPISAPNIKTIADAKSWLGGENSRLKEWSKFRCGNCLQINPLGDRCECKQREKQIEYQGIGGNPMAIMERITRKTKLISPPQEDLVRVVNLLVKHFGWAKDWWATEKGRISVTNYAKIVWRVGYFYLKARGFEKIYTK